MSWLMRLARWGSIARQRDSIEAPPSTRLPGFESEVCHPHDHGCVTEGGCLLGGEALESTWVKADPRYGEMANKDWLYLFLGRVHFGMP